MIPLKTAKEIEIIQEGGKKLVWVFQQVYEQVKPGVRLKDLDRLAEKLILKSGGLPSFKMVKNYRWATCINVNEGVVHGIPNEYRLKKGDLVTLDMGLFYQGFHTDMSRSFWLKNDNSDSKAQILKFLTTGEKTLKLAIKQAFPGKRVGHISYVIEREIKKMGYSPNKILTGHGVGKKLHEEPQIPCVLFQKIQNTPLLKEGMVLAIEVIYSEGTEEMILDKDGWTFKTKDGKLAAVFENTIAITKKGPKIITPLETKLEVC